MKRKIEQIAFGTSWLRDLLCKYWFTSSVWHFCHWVEDVPPRQTSPAARCYEKRLFSQASNSANSTPSPPLPPANVSFPLPAIFHFVSSGTHIKWNLFTPSIFFFKFPALLLVSVCVKLGYAHAWDSIRRWPHNACEVLIVFLNWKLHRLSRQNTTAHAQVWASPYLISVNKSHNSDWTFD